MPTKYESVKLNRPTLSLPSSSSTSSLTSLYKLNSIDERNVNSNVSSNLDFTPKSNSRLHKRRSSESLSSILTSSSSSTANDDEDRDSKSIKTFKSPKLNHSIQSLSSQSLDPLIDITRLRIPSSPIGCLEPGIEFKGLQRSGWQNYNVNVKIQDISSINSKLSGYLTIENLTQSQPTLTTFFTADIIGKKYGFRTNNYDASEKDDLKHWSKFPSFKSIKKSQLIQPNLTYDVDINKHNYVFMRWKEHYLVNDHKVRHVPGASFDGFYYICVDLSKNAKLSFDCGFDNSIPASGPTMTGYYFR